MANFDLSNFVIDRVIRGMMVSNSDDSILWSINQITNPSLNVTTESADAVDYCAEYSYHDIRQK